MEQSSVLSVTVIAKDAITADGYDTAFFVMGLDAIKRSLAKRKDIDVYVLYTNDEGKMEAFVTDGIKNFIKETAN
jgi:thiamine biosynthesis lipoprotein